MRFYIGLDQFYFIFPVTANVISRLPLDHRQTILELLLDNQLLFLLHLKLNESCKFQAMIISSTDLDKVKSGIIECCIHILALQSHKFLQMNFIAHSFLLILFSELSEKFEWRLVALTPFDLFIQLFLPLVTYLTIGTLFSNH